MPLEDHQVVKRGLNAKIVLVAPEIPFNTGAIGRTCVALDIELILIRPYGFSLDEKSVAEAGTRYWPHVQLGEYDSWDHFIANESLLITNFLFEEDGETSFYTPDYPENAYLVFGCNSGLPSDLQAL